MDINLHFNKQLNIKEHGLEWWNVPDSWNLNETGLTISMNAKQDFWRKTYYKPLMVKNDGHLLYKEFIVEENVMIETNFTLTPKNQFDQGGLMVYIDEEHWIKTGLEYTDGINRLSCVVTNGYSDWSTQDYGYDELTLRLYKLGCDFVIEAKNKQSPKEDSWSFIRICHLNIPESFKKVRLGLFACAPTKVGGSVLFTYAKYKNVDSYHHGV